MSDPFVSRGIRVAVVLPVILIVLDQILHLGAASLLGVFAVSGLLIIGDFRGPPIPRAVTLLVVSVGGAVMLVLGALAGTHEVTAVVGAAIAGFVLLLAGVYRGQFGRAGIPLLLPFLSEAANPAALATLPVALEAWLVGCLIASVGALVILPGYERDIEHPRFAAACAAFADAVPALWPRVTDDADAAYGRFATATAELDEKWQGNRSRPSGILTRDRAFISVLDYLHQIQTLCVTRIQTGKGTPASDPDLPLAVSATARSVAESMASGRPQVTLSGLVDVRGRQWDDMGAEFASAVETRDAEAAREVASRNFLLRVASLLTVGLGVQTEVALGGRPRTELLNSGAIPIPEWRPTPLRLLAQQLRPTSPWFRNAARGAFALAVAIAIARLPMISHGFWIVMGAIGALRFDAMGTGRTVRAAVVGQVVGFVVSFGIATTLRPYPTALALLIPIAGFLAGFAPPTRLWMPQAAFTILVVLCMALITPEVQGVPMTRFEDVLIGLAVSLVASLLLWPRGIQQHVTSRIVRAAVAVEQLLRHANRRLLGDETPDLDQATDHARMCLRSATEACDLAALEQPPQPPPTMSWTRLVMASRHVFFGCAILGNAPSVSAPRAVAAPLDEAATMAGERFLEAQDDVLAALAEHPGVDPGFTSVASSLAQGPRRVIRQLAGQAGTVAVAHAPPGPEGVALVQTVEWDGVWLEHVELTAGHLENRRDRIEHASVG
ncbi:MAG: FUSC family protein [Candidatus Nanopelagicales bacterium]